MEWLPCPNCRDDNTYRAEPTPPKPCSNCGVEHGVGKLGEKFVVVATKPAPPRSPRKTPDLSGPPKPQHRGRKNRGRRRRRKG